MTKTLTFQRTLRLHLGHEQAGWLRHETVTRFEDGRKIVTNMEFEKVDPEKAMHYPAAIRSCEEQAEYDAEYQREYKQGRRRKHSGPRSKRTPRPQPAPGPDTGSAAGIFSTCGLLNVTGWNVEVLIHWICW